MPRNPFGTDADVAPTGVLLRATIAGVAIASSVAVVWSTLGETTAMTVWLGILAMFNAVLHLSVRRQLVIGLSAGVSAGLGELVAGDLLLLGIVIVVGCLMQWPFDQWSAGSGALIPAIAFYYWEQAVEQPSLDRPAWQIVLATLLGVAIAMAVAVLVRLRGVALPAGRADTNRHLIGLLVGCLAIIVLIFAFDLPRGFWGVLTLCIVYRPTSKDTETMIWKRTLGTLVGAVLTVGLGIMVPKAVILAVAVLSGVFTLSFRLSNHYLRYSVSATITTVLLFGGGEPVLDLAEERAGMTMLGALFAALLVAITELLRRRATTISSAHHSHSGNAGGQAEGGS